MTSPRPGDVRLGSIPLSDGSGTKIRPVLVLWVDGADSIVVPDHLIVPQNQI